MTTSNETLPPADEGRRSSEGLGLEPERAKWYARGQDWALTSALTDSRPEWMSDDIANAYADGAMAAIAAERERCAKVCEAIGAEIDEGRGFGPATGLADIADDCAYEIRRLNDGPSEFDPSPLLA